MKGILSIDFIVTELNDNIFVSESRGGVKGLPISRHKWSKMAKNEFSCNWREDKVVIVWSSFFSVAITVTALSDNFFVNKIKGGVKG